MKRKENAALMVLVAVMMLIVSCGEDPFFHAVTMKYEDKVVKTVIVYIGEYTLPSEVEGIPDLEGWIYDGKEYAVGDKITVTGDIIITAVTGTPVVVTLYDDVTETIYLRKGETELTLPAAPTRTGYSFEGWKIGETTYAAGTEAPYTEGMTITGVWKKIYTVTYLANTGSGTVEPDTFKEGSEGVAIKDGTGFSKEGQSFSSWNTRADGKGTSYNPGSRYNENADLTLYAVWTSEITIIYKSEGHDDVKVTGSPADMKALTPDWTNAGYQFDGWYIGENGAGTYYAAGADIKVSTTLYAHWVDENLSFETVSGKSTYNAGIKSGKTDAVRVKIPAVYHGEKVTQIGKFEDCKKLVSVTFEKAENIDSFADYRAFMNCEELASIDLSGTQITVISNKSFEGCKKLSEVRLPSSLTAINMCAFQECTSLTSVNLPASLTMLGEYAFSETGLTSITVPEKVTTLEQYAFDECTALQTAEIKGSLKKLGTGVFLECTELTTVTLPDSIEIIGTDCFYDCTKLTSSINLPKVTSIESAAFFNCSGISSITIGSGITSIGDNAFCGTKNGIAISIAKTTSEISTMDTDSGSNPKKFGNMDAVITGSDGKYTPQ